jgi:hypothetical protein
MFYTSRIRVCFYTGREVRGDTMYLEVELNTISPSLSNIVCMSRYFSSKSTIWCTTGNLKYLHTHGYKLITYTYWIVSLSVIVEVASLRFDPRTAHPSYLECSILRLEAFAIRDGPSEYLYHIHIPTVCRPYNPLE